MRFDDRLSTVLRQTVAGEAIARIQYRQLLDLLGTGRSDDRSDQVDAAYMRLAELSADIPAPVRAKMLREPHLRLRNARLLTQLAEGEPAVAAAAIAAAELDDAQWADVIPALPIRARGFVRNRREIGPETSRLLERLGIADRGLPPATVDGIPVKTFDDSPPHPRPVKAISRLQLQPEIVEANDDEPGRRPAAAAAQQAPAEPAAARHEYSETIGAIVRRIEAFRKSREETGQQQASGVLHAPRLPLEDEAHHPSDHSPNIAAFDIETGCDGRVIWATPSVAPMIVGARLAAGGKDIARCVERRLPISARPIALTGANALAGTWRIDAAPSFSAQGGRFLGYAGRMRRIAPGEATALADTHQDSEEDRMRQVLHELRTPVNAIQGFAELIQQQLFGPTPHEYRALAASIASDSAHILAGFEELDRLVKLRSGALVPEPGTCDLGAIVEGTVSQLAAYTAPRKSGFAVTGNRASLSVALNADDAARMIWRLLATLAGAAAPGEVLKLKLRPGGETVRLAVRLPATLAARDDQGLFHASVPGQAQALASGMFGAGFSLRLVCAEAKAAGGALVRHGKRLRIELPRADRGSQVNTDERNPVHLRGGSN